MPAKLYPFIDIAVHERVREHFAKGDATVLFAQDMSRVLWSNGEGAGLFGQISIYDFIEGGANRNDAAFRQLEAAARQLENAGDRRQFLMRIASGFQRVPVNASVELIGIHPGEIAVLFAAPRSGKPLAASAIAAQMISGFDDPDTHMAVLDGDGGIIAESSGFSALVMTPQTRRALVSAVARDSDWLVKRPVPTGKGHLPAAIGKLSDDPPLHLLFAVETILGNLDSSRSLDDAEPEPKNEIVEAPKQDAQAGVPTASAAIGDAVSPPGHFAALTEAVAEEPASEATTGDTVAVAADEAAADPSGTGDAEPDATPDDVNAPAGSDGTEISSEKIEAESDFREADKPESGVAFEDEQDIGTTPQGDSEASIDVARDVPFEPVIAQDDGAGDNGNGLGDRGFLDIDQAVDEDGAAPDEQEEVVADEPSIEAADEVENAPVVDGDEVDGDSVLLDVGSSVDETSEDGAHEPDEMLRDTLATDAQEDGLTEAGTDIDMGLQADDPALADARPEHETSEEIPASLPTEGAAPSGHEFVFNPAMRAVRFVWKIDAGGSFSEVSEEFAYAVGPRSADISGRTFADLAARYNLDPGNTIVELLKRRDTWSGKTILWPIEGTSLHVPVDLAALPTYSRNREFDGFRGFGIVRVADAVEDAQAVGLTFYDAAAELPTEVPPETAEIDVTSKASLPAGDEGFLPSEEADDALLQGDDETSIETEVKDPDAPSDAFEIGDDDLLPDEDAGDVDAEASAPERGSDEDRTRIEDVVGDPFRGERPALKLVETTPPLAAENIVHLDTVRPAGTETLTRTEQAAFREIARQLGETFGKRTEKPEVTQEPAQEAPLAAPVETTAASDDVVVPDEAADIEIAADEGAVQPASETPVPIVPPRRSSDDGLTADILDNLPIALLVHGGDELFHANPEFLALTGYAQLSELQDEGGIDALFAPNEEGLFDLPEGAMMVIRKDGRLVPVAARLQSIRWEDKNALMMALSTPQTSAETPLPEPESAPVAPSEDMADDRLRTLKMEAEELRSILETATDGVVVVGGEGEIRSLNRSASALFNYDDGEVRGKPFAMLFAHESQKAVLDYLGGLSGHGVASVLNDGREVIGREASGGFIPLFMTMGRLSSSNGYCAVIRDITQWKRTEEELRNAKRAAETANAHKTDFLARVSHEIRTPLNAIIGFSDMTASEHFGPIGNPRYIEYANDIGRSGRHVLDIVNDLLDISKIEAGEMELEFTSVEINDAVSEAVSLVQPQANSQRVIIRTSLSGSVPNIVADSRSIKQIALNILSNAIRFTPSGGQIVVSTSYEPNGSVILRIRDSGIGMTRIELEQAMKPFRQVTTGARKRGDGTGLGLPLTKAMAEANRALFSINSAPNEGTLVEIAFPSQRVLAD